MVRRVGRVGSVGSVGGQCGHAARFRPSNMSVVYKPKEIISEEEGPHRPAYEKPSPAWLVAS